MISGGIKLINSLNIRSKIWRPSPTQNAITFFPLCTPCLLASSQFVFAWKYAKVSATEFHNIILYFFLPSSPLTLSLSAIGKYSNFIWRKNYRENMKKYAGKCQRSYCNIVFFAYTPLRQLGQSKLVLPRRRILHDRIGSVSFKEPYLHLFSYPIHCKTIEKRVYDGIAKPQKLSP